MSTARHAVHDDMTSSAMQSGCCCWAGWIAAGSRMPARWRAFTAWVTCRGTQGYMAPELTTGLHMASDKADVWSLGMTFLTMVTFHHPYEGLTSQQYDAGKIQSLPP